VLGSLIGTVVGAIVGAATIPSGEILPEVDVVFGAIVGLLIGAAASLVGAFVWWLWRRHSTR
jgi:hypothetical protein